MCHPRPPHARGPFATDRKSAPGAEFKFKPWVGWAPFSDKPIPGTFFADISPTRFRPRQPCRRKARLLRSRPHRRHPLSTAQSPSAATVCGSRLRTAARTCRFMATLRRTTACSRPIRTDKSSTLSCFAASGRCLKGLYSTKSTSVSCPISGSTIRKSRKPISN